MNIAVGSKNPVKIAAVENTVKQFWKDATVVGVEVNHGTDIQPRSSEEAIRGATARAQLALKEANADMGFGLEGNVFDSEHGMFVDGWVVAVDKNGTKGVGSCGSMMIPPKIAENVRKGMELGPAGDAHFNKTNIKQKEGLVGVLTDGKITRTAAFERGIVFALAKFLKPEYYK